MTLWANIIISFPQTISMFSYDVESLFTNVQFKVHCAEWIRCYTNFTSPSFEIEENSKFSPFVLGKHSSFSIKFLFLSSESRNGKFTLFSAL